MHSNESSFGPRTVSVDLTDGKNIVVDEIECRVWFDGYWSAEHDTWFEITQIEVHGKPVAGSHLYRALKADIAAQCGEDFDEIISNELAPMREYA